MIDLLELEDVKFCNYVRMPPVEEFNTLFSKVQPFITTKNIIYKVQVIRSFNTTK